MDNKTRKLSAYEFFQVLQVEWIIADLRSRIYPEHADQQYWTRVKEGKKKIIETIAERNWLPTIFTDSEMKSLLEKQVYQVKGAPAFSYKDEAQRRALQPLDLNNYYAKDADVRFDIYGDQKIGKIKSYIPFAQNIVVTYEDKETSLPVSEVTRII